MAVITTVRVEGLRELDDALGEMKKATAANILRRTLLKAGAPIEAMAKALAPRKTGRLADVSISLVPASPSKMTRTGRGAYDKKSFVEVLVEAGPEPQAVTQEFGTVNHPPHPFMRPAWLANKMAALAIVKKELWEEIQKAAARAARKAAKLAASR